MRIAGYDYTDSTGEMAPSMAQSAIDGLESKEGIVMALDSLDSFSPEIRTELLRSLALKNFRPIAVDRVNLIYQYLKNHPEEQSVWKSFLRNWAENDPKAMLVVLNQEPPEERYRKKLLLFGGIYPNGLSEMRARRLLVRRLKRFLPNPRRELCEGFPDLDEEAVSFCRADDLSSGEFGESG